VGKRGAGVADAVEIEEDGSRNVPRRVLLGGVAATAR
jgi:hypothetical protein